MSDFDIQVAVGEGVRRLPVYLLLDCSGSMQGAPIEAVRHGVELFAREVLGDEFAAQTVHVAVILFGGEARMVTSGLVPMDQFQPPALEARGGTPLGGALRLLNESLTRDLRPNVPGQPKGDWKPMAFIMTDGAATDDWRGPREAIINRQTGRLLNICTVGCGPGVDEALLKEIAVGPAFKMDDSEVSFKQFFQWVTASVRAVSVSLSQPSGPGGPVDLPQPPPVLQYID
ncbi:MAG: VWA domain-containing protein [Fimbriimonadaceae bacterium]|nr:VWA domain-containing protein [Fimbriimonadaceae bacterium]